MIRATIEIDKTQLFDTVKQVGNDAAGQRFLDLMLTLSTGRIGFASQMGAAIYGIRVVEADRFNEQEEQKDSAKLNAARRRQTDAHQGLEDAKKEFGEACRSLSKIIARWHKYLTPIAEQQDPDDER